jgi:mycothiol system anti-sigma-R factor
MADCDEILREIEAFLDGELTPASKASIQEHLDRCLDCLHVFDFHAELRWVIAQKCRETKVPPGLLDRVRQCLDDPSGAPPPESAAS